MTTEPEEPRPVDDAAADIDVAADDLPEESPESTAGPVVQDNRGQVANHVDRMNQINNNYWLHHNRAVFALSRGSVRLIMDTFVEREYRRVGSADGPVDSHSAARMFDGHRCLLLVGPADSGRRTAAVALLSHTGGSLHVLPADDDNHRLLPVGEFAWPEDDEPAAYLVEVPSGAERHSRLPEQLAAYRQEVERREALLVMLIDPETWEAIEGVPDYVAVRVAGPNPYAVMEVLLQTEREHWDTDRLLHEKRVSEVLNGATPRQVERLYRRVVAAAGEVRAQEVADPVAAIAAMAVSAYENWDKELADWFEEHTDPRTRLFLIALAFLDGEPAADVLDQAERLASTLGVSKEFRGGISGTGIRQLARLVGAHVDDNWRIRFTRTAYGTSVLRFVHGDQSAEFRRQLWVWAAALPLRRGAPHQRTANEVARAMLGIHLAMPRPNIPELRLLVHSWWRYPTLRPLVTNLITELALSPEAGSIIRARLLRWSEASGDSRVLEAVAAVCAGQFADAYPQAAFTRLNRLASRMIVDNDVVDAIAELWSRSTHRRTVLRQVVGWAAEDGPRRAVGLSALAAITTTEPDVRAVFEELAGDDTVRADLVQAFSDLFVPPGPFGEFRQAFKVWLEVAAEHQGYRDLIARLLLHGGTWSGDDGVSARYATMNTLLFEWRPVLGDDENPRARDFRAWLAERLIHADPLTNHRPSEPRAAA
ncbi:hypothetical protein AB0M36_32640 [Actinoplanes sp. NPDC051346]|uniref:hypothetical protein n=1 Tax=Actinoplanes sp. NPDC051346 TaxID=3155048 RepID=UPI00342AD491